MLKAGIAKCKISPDVNLIGSFRLHWEKKPLGIHDDLYATALYLNDGCRQLMMLSLDLVQLTNAVAAAIRNEICQQTKIEICNITLSCTHTHNSIDFIDEDNVGDARVFDELKSQIVNCAIQAIEKAEKAKIGFGECCIPVAKNRLSCSWDPAFLSLGAMDPICDIIKIESVAGKTLGVFFHYSAHPTCAMGSEFLISRDCIGVAVDIIEERYKCHAGFFQGAAGNVNFHLGERAFKYAAEKGEILADYISRSVPGIECSADISIDSREQIIELEKRTDYDFTIEEVDREITTLTNEFESLLEQNDDPFKIFHVFNVCKTWKWKKMLYESNKTHPNISVVIQAIKLGDVDIITVPGEIFVEYQLAFRVHGFPKHSMIFGYANGYVGYIPTKAAVQTGGYGTEPNIIQQVYPEAGETMLNTGIELLKTLHR